MDVTADVKKKRGRKFLYGFFSLREVNPDRIKPRDLHIALAKTLCQHLNVPLDHVEFDLQHHDQDTALMLNGRTRVLPVPPKVNDEGKALVASAVTRMLEEEDELFRVIWKNIVSTCMEAPLPENVEKTLDEIVCKVLNRLHIMSLELADDIERIVDEYARAKGRR